MPAEITKAKKLLKEICIKYKKTNKYIMQGIKGEELHALDVLGWVKKLNPGASLPLKLATLFHDVDRIVTPMAGGGFKGARIGKKYEKHSKNKKVVIVKQGKRLGKIKKVGTRKH